MKRGKMIPTEKQGNENPLCSITHFVDIFSLVVLFHFRRGTILLPLKLKISKELDDGYHSLLSLSGLLRNVVKSFKKQGIVIVTDPRVIDSFFFFLLKPFTSIHFNFTWIYIWILCSWVMYNLRWNNREYAIKRLLR